MFNNASLFSLHNKVAKTAFGAVLNLFMQTTKKCNWATAASCQIFTILITHSLIRLYGVALNNARLQHPTVIKFDPI
jgi:hypothetical protein